MAIAILGDTHMPRGSRRLPDGCVRLLGRSELIVHTGDFHRLETFELIASIGPPLIAVAGNVDERALADRLPQETTFEIGARTVGLVHDAGQKDGRLARMRRRFPGADAVIFGHSHLPLHERDDDGFQIFNPGSPTERRRAPRHSMGIAEADSAGNLVLRHVWLD
ncbi:MAG: metallophosphoesterase family protein [Solirubrobacterales bacterium]